tara:strand:- start:236 stop:601 length:366 start_codon:yes stop_codon:yes gene_type:complete
MSTPVRLFQHELTATSTDATVAEHLFTAPEGGPTMVTALWLAPSQGATNNVARIHHLLPAGDQDPATSNILFYGTVSNADALDKHYESTKIILQPGERLYGQLHSGTAVCVSAYGIIPRNA